MPNNPYDKKILLQVPLPPGVMIFRSNMDSTLYSDLGVSGLTSGSTPLGAFFQANSPKPAVAKRVLVSGRDSFFCDFSKAALLRADGWNVRPPKYRGVLESTSGARAITRYVLTAGLKYAWNEPIFKLITQSVRTALGVESPTDSDRLTLIWGSTFPHPALVKIVTDTTGTTGPSDTVSSFAADAKLNSLPANAVLARARAIFMY